MRKKRRTGMSGWADQPPNHRSYRKSKEVHVDEETGWFEFSKGDIDFKSNEGKKEVQSFTTKVDVGDAISSGSFWLSFRNERSGEIPWNADAEKVERALADILTISAVKVRRILIILHRYLY